MTPAELKALIQEGIADALKDQSEAAAKARGMTQAELDAADSVERAEAAKWREFVSSGGAAQAPERKTLKDRFGTDQGTMAGRYVRAIAAARLNGIQPDEQLERWKAERGDDGIDTYIQKAMKGNDAAQAKALSEGALDGGGALVAPEFSADLIPLLRNKVVVRRMGARVLPLRSSSLTIPKVTGGGTAYYVGENTAATKSEQTTGQLIFTAKKLVALTPVSNDLLRDASEVADEFVRDDLVQVVAEKEDATFLRGVGSESAPRGLLYEIASANKFDANGTINATNVIADLATAMQNVMGANTPMIRPGWMFATRTWKYLYTLRDSDGWVFKDEMDQGTLFRFPFEVTEQIPINLATGSNSSEVYFGDFSEALIAENLSLAVEAFPNAAYHDGSNVQSGVSNDQSVIRVMERHDFHLRHDTSFTVIEECDWGV